jgi:hypothetical protein
MEKFPALLEEKEYQTKEDPKLSRLTLQIEMVHSWGRSFQLCEIAQMVLEACQG